jgi:hypothetical protein
MYFVADPHTGFRLQPNSAGWFQDGIPARTNSHGHRNPEVPLEKPAGAYRIVIVGDSFSVGANVREAESWPRLLERLLQQSSHRPIEVVNTAVGGWEPLQYAHGFAQDGRRFGADMVVVGFFVGNDTYASTRLEDTLTAIGGRRVTRTAATSSTIELRVWLYERFNLARLVLNRGPRVENFTRSGCDDFSSQYLGIQTARLRNHLHASRELEDRAQLNVDQVASIARQAPVVVVVLIPDENQLNSALQARIAADSKLYDWNMPQAMLVPKFERSGVVVVDLLDAFRSDTRCLYMNDTHWTPQGHELAAGIVASRIDEMLR